MLLVFSASCIFFIQLYTYWFITRTRVQTKLLDFFIVYHIYAWWFYTRKKSMWILILCLWLIFWSLGSVILTRFSDGITRTKLRGFFFWYSQCPQCKHRLVAKDLVPVVSYLFQWGKCRYCGKKISRLYPVLELLCAWMFVLSYFLLKDLWNSMLVFWLLTNWLLILLLVYDLLEYELHMTIRILLVVVWILMNIFVPEWDIVHALLSAVLFGVVFMGIYFFAKRYAKMRFKKTMEWFGQGDVYLAASIWMFIPLLLSIRWIAFSWWILLNVLILFILLSSILGLIWSGFQYLVWKLILNSQPSILNSQLNIIPFFPAMILAFWIISRKTLYFITLFFG